MCSNPYAKCVDRGVAGGKLQVRFAPSLFSPFIPKPLLNAGPAIVTQLYRFDCRVFLPPQHGPGCLPGFGRPIRTFVMKNESVEVTCVIHLIDTIAEFAEIAASKSDKAPKAECLLHECFDLLHAYASKVDANPVAPSRSMRHCLN